MRVLDLFSGIGGMSLGLTWAGMTTIGFCEIEEHLHPILTRHFPGVPIFHDIREFTESDIRGLGRIDLVCGGFPCQDISNAAAEKASGLGGDRSSLWWEMWRVVRTAQPSWVLIENVPALRVKGVDEILLSLETIGYTCSANVVGAEHVASPQIRHRVWIVAHKQVDDAPHEGLEGERKGLSGFPSGPDRDPEAWEAPRCIEPRLVLPASRLSRRLALRALGNCVVPQVVEMIGRAILRINGELYADNTVA